MGEGVLPCDGVVAVGGVNLGLHGYAGCLDLVLARGNHLKYETTTSVSESNAAGNTCFKNGPSAHN